MVDEKRKGSVLDDAWTAYMYVVMLSASEKKG